MCSKVSTETPKRKQLMSLSYRLFNLKSLAVIFTVYSSKSLFQAIIIFTFLFQKTLFSTHNFWNVLVEKINYKISDAFFPNKQ